ncbi:MAG TPA: EI24 domain-containing protein [Burkholderiaceae bacterium]|nr:EI24 domain-containing protein [Burkholderiaceae bacterium]
MTRAAAALLRAFVSLLHPRMLLLLLLPLVVAIVFWVLAAWLLWEPVTAWLAAAIFDGTGTLGQIYQWSLGWGLGDVRAVLPALIALLLLFPLMGVTAVLLTALFAMPAVLRHLQAGPYRDLERRGGFAIAASGWNAVSSTVLFALGYLVTLPLWLIPPFALLIPWLWWSWLTARVMSFDSSVEHADAAERRTLLAGERNGYLILGMMVSALNYVPPLFLVTPVLAALAFAHYSLAALRERRRLAAAVRR